MPPKTRVRRLLLDEQRALADQLARSRRDADLWLSGEAAENSFDEDGGEGSARSVEVAREEALQAQLLAGLAEVDAALVRLDAGTYGRCEACGEPIGDGRLEALPTARQCVACKSAGPLRRRVATGLGRRSA